MVVWNPRLKLCPFSSPIYTPQHQCLHQSWTHKYTRPGPLSFLFSFQQHVCCNITSIFKNVKFRIIIKSINLLYLYTVVININLHFNQYIIQQMPSVTHHLCHVSTPTRFSVKVPSSGSHYNEGI